jgi:hypothetical protein
MNCPHHPAESLTTEPSKYGDLLVCPVYGCNYAVSARQPVTAEASFLAPGAVADAPEPAGDSSGAERLLVARIIAKLESEGYEVLRVGQYKAKGSGTDEGYPDLSVRKNGLIENGGWPRSLCALLEVKTATGRVRKRQAELNAAGWSHIVRSAEQALEVMQQVSETVGVAERESDGT